MKYIDLEHATDAEHEDWLSEVGGLELYAATEDNLAGLVGMLMRETLASAKARLLADIAIVANLMIHNQKCSTETRAKLLVDIANNAMSTADATLGSQGCIHACLDITTH